MKKLISVVLSSIILMTCASVFVNAEDKPEIKDKEIAIPATVKALIDKQSFTSEVAFYNIRTGEYYTYKGDDMVYAASIVKLPFSYYAYQQVEEGAVKLTEEKVYDAKFRRGGTGVMKNQKTGTKYTMEKLLYNTIQSSDNTAYFMLLDRFGKDNYNKMLELWGYKTSLKKGINYGKVSANLISKTLKEVYKNKDKDDNWKKLYSSMSVTTYSPIRSSLSVDYTVANKTGWDEDAYHDGAIITSKDKELIVVILTQSGGSPKGQTYIRDLTCEIVNTSK